MAQIKPEYQSLIEAARSAHSQALAPFSQYRVGVALLCDDGTVVTGCNVEANPTGMSTCAERTAMVKALSEGRKTFQAIAIVAATGTLCWPCGGCRQTLFHFAPNIDVVVEGEQRELLVRKLIELLPQFKAKPVGKTI